MVLAQTGIQVKSIPNSLSRENIVSKRTVPHAGLKVPSRNQLTGQRTFMSSAKHRMRLGLRQDIDAHSVPTSRNMKLAAGHLESDLAPSRESNSAKVLAPKLQPNIKAA